MPYMELTTYLLLRIFIKLWYSEQKGLNSSNLNSIVKPTFLKSILSAFFQNILKLYNNAQVIGKAFSECHW